MLDIYNEFYMCCYSYLHTPTNKRKRIYLHIHQCMFLCNPYSLLCNYLSNLPNNHSSTPSRFGSRGLVRGMVLGLAQLHRGLGVRLWRLS